MTSSALPAHPRPGATSASTPAPARPWYRTIPRPTWVTAIFALLPWAVSFDIENMRTVNGEVVEFFRLDVFQLVAAVVLLGAFVAILLPFRTGADRAQRPPVWTLAVGAAGVVLAVYLAMTAHTGIDDITAVLAAA